MSDEMRLEEKLTKTARVFHLIDGTTLEGKAWDVDTYNILLALEDGTSIWLPKHSILYANLKIRWKKHAPEDAE